MEAQLQHQEGGQSKKPQSDVSNSPPPSPSHEFSFTPSLHPSSKLPNKTTSPSSFAIDDDLSPADDIFFHGHLLPLHFISQLPITPRSSISTDSSESFNLPVRPDELEDIEVANNCSSSSNSNNNTRNCGTKGGIKAKSFTFLWSGKWRRSGDVEERKKEEEKKKMKFEPSSALKKCLRTIRPLLLFRRRKKNDQLCKQPNLFSCNSSLEEMIQWGEVTEFSSPVTTKTTSPTNRVPLFSTVLPTSNNANDSTMEEIQSAIQAAIAHCKNSIAVKEEKLKC